MKKMIFAALLATAPAVLVAGSAIPASAQVAGGVATVNLQAAVEGTNAAKTAMTQVRTTYAQLIQQIEARQQALSTEIGGMEQRLQQAAAQPNANQAALQQQSNQLDARRDAAEAELSRMATPISRAQAYIQEQIGAQLPTAVTNVMNTNRVNILVDPQAVLKIGSPQFDLTDRVTAELNRLVPSVSTTVPANWQPGQGGQTGAPAATPAATPRSQPQGR